MSILRISLPHSHWSCRRWSDFNSKSKLVTLNGLATSPWCVKPGLISEEVYLMCFADVQRISSNALLPWSRRGPSSFVSNSSWRLNLTRNEPSSKSSTCPRKVWILELCDHCWDPHVDLRLLRLSPCVHIMSNRISYFSIYGLIVRWTSKDGWRLNVLFILTQRSWRGRAQCWKKLGLSSARSKTSWLSLAPRLKPSRRWPRCLRTPSRKPSTRYAASGRRRWRLCRPSWKVSRRWPFRIKMDTESRIEGKDRQSSGPGCSRDKEESNRRGVKQKTLLHHFMVKHLQKTPSASSWASSEQCLNPTRAHAWSRFKVPKSKWSTENKNAEHIYLE